MAEQPTERKPRRDCKYCWGKGWVVSQEPGRGRVKVQCQCLHPQSPTQRKTGAMAAHILQKLRAKREDTTVTTKDTKKRSEQ